ncbi:solute carrier organic anion transporter family member 4A1 [Ctenodactylus gundi]
MEKADGTPHGFVRPGCDSLCSQAHLQPARGARVDGALQARPPEPAVALASPPRRGGLSEGSGGELRLRVPVPSPPQHSSAAPSTNPESGRNRAVARPGPGSSAAFCVSSRSEGSRLAGPRAQRRERGPGSGGALRAETEEARHLGPAPRAAPPPPPGRPRPDRAAIGQARGRPPRRAALSDEWSCGERRAAPRQPSAARRPGLRVGGRRRTQAQVPRVRLGTARWQRVTHVRRMLLLLLLLLLLSQGGNRYARKFLESTQSVRAHSVPMTVMLSGIVSEAAAMDRATGSFQPALKPLTSLEMFQHAIGDKRFLPMPQHLFASMPLAIENGFDHTLPCSRASPGSVRSAADSPLNSCSRPLCEPLAEKHSSQAAREVRYVSAGPQDAACGWRSFAPECLQVFNTPKGFLFFLCVASFLQGMTVNGFINTVITSIERRYDLHSYQSGLIASSYDIAACLCLTFVSYFGGSGHKPRWLGWGVLVLGAGSLVFALPHFIAGHYRPVEVDEGVGMCLANQSVACADSTSSLSNYQLVFMLGQFLHGMGATPLYTLGVTYLDENVKSSYSPVYIAIFYTAAILGPAAGYLIGGAMLNIYTEVGQRTHLTTESPLWVGAWWIGFLGAGVAAFFTAIPILGYPRQLPGSQRYVIMRVAETQHLKDHSHKTASNPAFGKTIRDLPLSIWILLKNPTFILLCLAGATEAMLIAGMSTFGPKFLEAQFSLSSSEAATLFGYLVVPAGGGGTLLGGFLVNRFKLRGSGIIRFCLLCTLTSLFAFFVFFMHCPNVPMAGVTVGYNGSLLPEGQLNLTAACNAHCGCQPEHYSPVCGSDGTMYYSPCHAGCPTVAKEGLSGRKVYQDCSCVPTSFGNATAGKCTSTCPRKPLLLVLLFVVIIFTFLSSIPALTATLRCVCDQQRSFALGIQWIVVRTLGSIPGPIAFGWVIDKACLLWQNQCGHQGSCFVYQNAAMSHYILAAGLSYKVLGFLFFATARFLYKPRLGSLDGLEISLPSQSSASENPTDLQLQSDV